MKEITRRKRAVNYIKKQGVRNWVKNKIADEEAGIDVCAGREGYVYIFSLGNGTYKIGHTTNVLKRQKALRAGNSSLRCIWSARVRDRFACESELHKVFKQKKVEREIFSLSQDDVMKANRLAENYR